jgi:hypothetical protein
MLIPHIKFFSINNTRVMRWCLVSSLFFNTYFLVWGLGRENVDDFDLVFERGAKIQKQNINIWGQFYGLQLREVLHYAIVSIISSINIYHYIK